ncbi:MAG: glycosyltransferase family 39 protein [Gammaproteobacteria bacterium]|nr:glycosyltransferase family 39 protein [Gammaproteobacteria bacterium]
MTESSRGTLTDLAWIGAWFALLILAGYGLRDPWPADEPRFAGVALDMVRSGNWLIPHAGGDLYQDKPPLHFWLMGIGFLLTDSLRLGFLLPSMLASLGTLLLVYDLVRRFHGREAGRLAAVTLATCIHFVMTTRGAQIDATLIFFCTLALWGLMRHALQGAPLWVALLGAFGAGLGVIDKAVGFLTLAVLPIAFWLSARMRSQKLRMSSLLAVLAVFAATIMLWLGPMLWHVVNQGTPELAAYRDEILFKQTVTRYTQAWHHIRPWFYYIVEVIPVLWLPLSALLFWLVPRWRSDWREGRVAVWLPLLWAIFVIVFFSLSAGKRGVYVLPALPALAIAAAPHLPGLFATRGVQRLSAVLALLLVVPGVVLALVSWFSIPQIVDVFADSELSSLTPIYAFAALASVAWVLALKFKPILAWPSALACLTLTWGFGVAPQINGERSASEFIRQVTAAVPEDRELGLLAYKEQFLLYLDRDTVNFGHARWREGDAEAFDAALWLSGNEQRVLLVPEHFVQTCFGQNPRQFAGESSDDRWYLITGTPSRECVERGNPQKVIRYPTPEPL